VGLVRVCPTLAWRHPAIAPAVVLSVIVLLYFVDCLFNAMLNPTYTMAAGGLVRLILNLAKKPAKPLDRIEEVQWAPQS
jgi:hypothetical protein